MVKQKVMAVAVALLAVALVGCSSSRLGYTDQKTEDAMLKWHWAHYTGWRMSCGVAGSQREFYRTVDYPVDCAQDSRGLIIKDQKTGVNCTMEDYPGYPACPPQEYVVNGVLASVPDIRITPQNQFTFSPAQMEGHIE